MTAAMSHQADQDLIRAIVFREGQSYVAQCLEIDIAAQAPDIESVLQQLDLTIEAEMMECEGVELTDRISPAPNYYHTLWKESAIKLARVSVPGINARRVDAALAKAA